MKIKGVIRALNSDAKIFETIRGNIDVSEIIGSKSFDYEKVSQSAAWISAINGNHEEKM